MTDREHAAALYQPFLQLDELITADEIETEPVLEHLSDLKIDKEEAEQEAA